MLIPGHILNEATDPYHRKIDRLQEDYFASERTPEQKAKFNEEYRRIYNEMDKAVEEATKKWQKH